jgi:hypothetical protein
MIAWIVPSRSVDGRQLYAIGVFVGSVIVFAVCIDRLRKGVWRSRRPFPRQPRRRSP